MNIATWDAPSLQNIVYNFGDRGIEDGINSSLNTLNLHEIDIVSYERDVWLKYLYSKGTEEDKKNYLDSFFEGKINFPHPSILEKGG